MSSSDSPAQRAADAALKAESAIANFLAEVGPMLWPEEKKALHASLDVARRVTRGHP